MEDKVNVAEETGGLKKPLQEAANNANAVLMAFIAPYGAVRVSPIEERSASIRIIEEWGIEFAAANICSQIAKPARLYLLINTPGGIPPSCYNIAHMLRSCFSYIKCFVPQMALSGGTLIALSCNELVMGAASRLSPIDVQVSYGDTQVSAYAMGRALSRLTEYFKTLTPEEAPYPWRAMADKLDPIILEAWSTSLAEISRYAIELLKSSGYKEEECHEIVKSLVLTENTHSFVVHRDRAKKMGLKVSDNPDDMKLLNLMRTWLAEYAFESKVTHCIRYVLPNDKTGGECKDESTNIKAARKGKRIQKG
jgi:hypothetical protein